MEIFLTSISGILVILGMILVGFVMGEKGWFDDKSRGLIAKIGHPNRLALLYALYHHAAFHSQETCLRCCQNYVFLLCLW